MFQTVISRAGLRRSRLPVSILRADFKEGRAVTRCEFGSLCCLDFHEAGQGPQTGDHRNLMVMNFKAVKAEGDCTVGAVCRALH